MDVFKRYFFSFLIASVIIFVIAYNAEKYYEGQMPHKLTQETRDELIVKIPSGQGYETCLSLQKTKKLEYSFEAEEALEFNLHYHLEGETIFDQHPKMLQTYMGNFTPKEDAGYYCLMWGNPAEKPVSLNFRFEVLKP